MFVKKKRVFTIPIYSIYMAYKLYGCLRYMYCSYINIFFLIDTIIENIIKIVTKTTLLHEPEEVF